MPALSDATQDALSPTLPPPGHRGGAADPAAVMRFSSNGYLMHVCLVFALEEGTNKNLEKFFALRATPAVPVCVYMCVCVCVLNPSPIKEEDYCTTTAKTARDAHASRSRVSVCHLYCRDRSNVTPETSIPTTPAAISIVPK